MAKQRGRPSPGAPECGCGRTPPVTWTQDGVTTCIYCCAGCRRRYGLYAANGDTRKDVRHDASRRDAAQCGTDSGYRAHRRKGEQACLSCKQAHADITAARKAWQR